MDAIHDGTPLEWCCSILQTLNNYRKDGILCDVQLLSAEGTNMGAHSCVLAAVMPAFLEPEGMRHVRIVQTALSYNLLESVISLAYTGILEGCTHSGTKLAKASSELGIRLWPSLYESLVSDAEQEFRDSKEEVDGGQKQHLNFITMKNIMSQNNGPQESSNKSEEKRFVLSDEDSFRAEKSIAEKSPRIVGHRKECKSIRAQGDLSLHKCKTCGREFRSFYSLISHNKCHRHQKPFKCEECPRSFYQSSFLEKHLRSHTKERVFKCSLCDATFSRKDCLENHKKHVHSEAEPFLCRFCGKKFKRSQSVRNHEKFHRGEKNLECEQCGKTFFVRDHLRRHVLEFHTDNCPFKCKECGLLTMGHAALARHMRVHSGERPYQCDNCGATFKQRGQLNRHKMVHTGEKPFLCSYCPSCFRTEGQLVEHIRVHTNERPYKCLEEDCDKAFKTTNALRNHSRTHTGEKPFVCAQCGKAFANSSNLNAHERIHRGETSRRKAK